MSAIKRGLLLGAAALGLAVFIYRKRDAFLTLLAVLIFSCGFTLLLAPLCAYLERRGLSASAAAARSCSSVWGMSTSSSRCSSP